MFWATLKTAIFKYKLYCKTVFLIFSSNCKKKFDFWKLKNFHLGLVLSIKWLKFTKLLKVYLIARTNIDKVTQQKAARSHSAHIRISYKAKHYLTFPSKFPHTKEPSSMTSARPLFMFLLKGNCKQTHIPRYLEWYT